MCSALRESQGVLACEGERPKAAGRRSSVIGYTCWGRQNRGRLGSRGAPDRPWARVKRQTRARDCWILHAKRPSDACLTGNRHQCIARSQRQRPLSCDYIRAEDGSSSGSNMRCDGNNAVL